MKKQKESASKIKLTFLGGLGEIGKNMMVIEDDENAVILDAGLMFPTEQTPGIDLILPDFSYALKVKNKIKAIILTHGHEDHIGAVPYLLRYIRAPIYGSKLTLGLLKPKLKEQSLKAELKEITSRSRLKIGSFKFEFIPQIHSIPDGMAVAIHTPYGIILHSGDFKFDTTPLPGQKVHYERFAELAKEGVILLLSDSTNAEEHGITPPERIVADRLKEIFLEARGKVIVASFASHIHRIQNIFDAARAAGRQVALSGRSMRQSTQVAMETGHLKISQKQLIDINRVGEMPDHQICILCTGSQGEPLSALSLIASHEHRHIQVGPGDTVVIAASPIPGNERSVSNIINSLMKSGAEVIYSKVDRVHVSGHASQEELKLLLNLTRPQYFVPIHGEFRHLFRHAQLAVQTGINEKNIFTLENGDSLVISEKGVCRTRHIDCGVIYVDGLHIGDLGKQAVLRDRKDLARSGIVFVVAAIDRNNRRIIYGPDLITKGIQISKEDIKLATDRLYRKILKILNEEEMVDIFFIKNRVSESLNSFLYEKTRKRPLVMPFFIEV